jgi:hypothetical protein
MADIRVRVGQQNTIKVLSSNASFAGGFLGDLTDVDATGRGDKFVLVYNKSTQKYEFVDPDVVLVAAAATVNTDSVPGLPSSFIQALDTDPNREENIDIDGGTW